MTNRSNYKQGRFVYLLDDTDHTAWIKRGHIGRCKTYHVPSRVMIEGVRYTVTSIELGAYNIPKTLRHLIIPDSIEYVDEDELCGLSNLQSIHIGKGLKCLQNWHFRSCPKCRLITIDKDNPHLKVHDGMVLTKDGTILLRSLFHRKELRIPEGVKYVEKVAFWYDKKLETIIFPTTLKEISDNSFANLPKLRNVVLPEGVEKLVVQCFRSCVNLEYVDLPASLKVLGWGSLSGCKNLKTLILRSPRVLEYEMEETEPYIFETCHIQVPAELVEAYRLDPNWSLFKHIEPIVQ